MKTRLLVLILLLRIQVFGQNNNNVWQISLSPYAFVPTNPTNQISFSSGFPDTSSIIRELSFFITNTAISDAAGNLLFYTNGQWIANSNHDTLLNSKNFNPGWATDTFYCNPCTGLGYTQAALILPMPDSINKFYILNITTDRITSPNGFSVREPLSLDYSIINMNLDNGLGGIETGRKDLIAIADTVLPGYLNACKHANGRDWWVLIQKYNSNIWYKLLITPTGIQSISTQAIGSFAPERYDFYGQSCFAPDGNKFARVLGATRTLDVFDFDRCNGMLTNDVSFATADTFWQPVGCAFSPNGNYLYVATQWDEWQYDVNALSIPNSCINVGHWDSTYAPFYAIFFIHQLGPDGKIYISTGSGDSVVHQIQNPDLPGLQCNFTQHSLILPKDNNISLPQYPNYNLGALTGSICDTLTNLTPGPSPPERGVSVVPNPNNGNFIVNYFLPQNKAGTLQILDVMGKQIYKQTLPQWSVVQRISLPLLAKGIYVLKVSCEGNSSAVKFVKE